MAGGQERVLRRRIRSVQSTKKITKAMELIAASRIVKAQQAVAAARPYADAITRVIGNLGSAGASSQSSSALLQPRQEVRTVGFVAIGGDRGLCGGYNTNVIRMTEASIRKTRAEGLDYRLFCVGKKIEAYFRFRGYDIAAAINGTSDRPTYEDARRVAAHLIVPFEEGEVDRVELVFTQFLSAGSQKVVQRRFMPIDADAVLSTGLPIVAGDAGAGGGGGAAGASGPHADYEYEPAPGEILDRLLPRYAEAKLFSAMLEGSASFFAAQQRAMASASDNADELITKLTRLRNRARQDAITTEIMEIVSGAEALAPQH
ncbi:MAG TPA: F0F1 ATP synthase subunit gamma [Acidimicrobiales bacterium]|nr:F0F1 ATP synthase subunit gamma [Acidimicrobiales bacterium]